MSNAHSVAVQFPEVRIVGDYARVFRIVVFDEETGQPFSLSGGVATFKLVSDDGLTTVVNELPCTIEDSMITYYPTPSDVANPGHFIGRFKVVTSAQTLKFGPYLYEICSDL